ncbi:putative ATPase [Murinocardiopsis flavida]|uniref:Putative ATPase n=1 Tax=Murinocardiopsis flavida TaxID=645275 RepID=A0A2P8CZ30_9ACTN|nr:BTAD domain-containing putative transcriptional regulator [Murinocardiopsis flavida]PSK90213.1 putative ATPase [Murinocardiopsis flavida]
MRFCVLGPLAVWTDAGAPVPVPGRKVRALLADLLLHEGRPVPADRLIDDLWGGSPPGSAAATLSAKVSQLRRALEQAEPGGRALVRTGPAGYRLETPAEARDTHRFEILIAEARACADPRALADTLAAALALWRGPAFADFADEPFTLAAAARLAELRLTAQEDHAEALLALGEHAALVAALGDLVAAHPLRERLRAAHMRALYRSGRQSEALASYADLRRRHADELGLDPGAELAALHGAILRQDPELQPPARPPVVRVRQHTTNLPTALGELVGRDDAVAGVRAALADDRLVTLTGPGGVGKTRLAVATAAQADDAFPDGVRLIELAALDHPGSSAEPGGALIDLVTAVLDIHDSVDPGDPRSPLQRLTGSLRSRRLLLVLDNCEHIVEQAAELADRLLRAAPGVRILATSREPLGVGGEVVWAVPPLEVPALPAAADPAVLERSSAVRLFVARARAAARGFALDAATGPAVAMLCRRLDGIPLALELAATRVPALGVHGLVDRLDDRFRLLATGHRGRPPRQQTLMAMIDWSWELLSGPERAVLRRLSAHSDGCTAEAAEAVCAGGDVPAADVLDLLARLVDRSLVVAVHDEEGSRYRLLESVAAYCAERMADAGETAEVRLRHHRYYADLAERAEPHLRGHDQRRWLRLLTAEAANLRGALDGAVADGHAAVALRLAASLAWYWFLRGRLGEARRFLDTALAADGGDPAGPAAPRARAASWAAGMAFLNGDTARWAERSDTALRLFDGVDDPAGRARAECFLAFAGSDAGDLEAGDALLDRSTAGFDAIADAWGTAAVLLVRAKHAHVRGELAVLERYAARSAELFRGLGDRWGQLQATAWLSALAEMTGDYERADRLQRDGLRDAEALGLWPEISSGLCWLSWIALQTADYEQARELSTQARSMAVDQGSTTTLVLADLVRAFTARKEGRFDDAEKYLHELRDNAPKDDTGAGHALYLPMVLVELGFLAEQRGDPAGAARLHLEARAIGRELTSPGDVAGAVAGLAGACALTGRAEDAAVLLGAAAAARDEAGRPVSPTERVDIHRVTAAAREALGEAAYTAAYARGSALTRAEADTAVDRVAALLGGAPQRHRRGAPDAGP